MSDDILFKLAVDRIAEHGDDSGKAFEAYRIDAWSIYNADEDGERNEFAHRAVVAWQEALGQPITDEPHEPPEPFALACMHEVYIRRRDLLRQPDEES